AWSFSLYTHRPHVTYMVVPIYAYTDGLLRRGVLKDNGIIGKRVEYFRQGLKDFLQSIMRLVTPILNAENESYIICLRFGEDLSVVNNCAEKGVKLVQDFCKYYTKDEKRSQYILRM
ncbi:hypothetical protein PV325_012603, partial [Microctonus aethiopoides]